MVIKTEEKSIGKIEEKTLPAKSVTPDLDKFRLCNRTPHWDVDANYNTWLFIKGHQINYQSHHGLAIAEYKEFEQNVYMKDSLRLLKEQAGRCEITFKTLYESWNLIEKNSSVERKADKPSYAYDQIDRIVFPDTISSSLNTEDSHFGETIKPNYDSLIDLLKDRINVIRSFDESIDKDMSTVDDNIYSYFEDALVWNTYLISEIRPQNDSQNIVMPWLRNWFSTKECEKYHITTDSYTGLDSETVGDLFAQDWVGNTLIKALDVTHDKNIIFPDSIQSRKNMPSDFTDDSVNINFDSIFTLGLARCNFNNDQALTKDSEVVIPIAKACLYVVFNGLYCRDKETEDTHSVCVITNNIPDVAAYIKKQGYPDDPWIEITSQLRNLDTMLNKIVATLQNSEIRSNVDMEHLSHYRVFSTEPPQNITPPDHRKSGENPKIDTPRYITGPGPITSGPGPGHPQGVSKEDIEKLINEKMKAHATDTSQQNAQKGQSPFGGGGGMPNISPSGLNPSLTVPGGGSHDPVAPTSAHEHDPDAKHHHHKTHHHSTVHKPGGDYDIISNPNPDNHDHEKVKVDDTVPSDPIITDHGTDNNPGVVDTKIPPNINGARDTVMIHGVKCHFSDTDLGGSQSGAKAALMATHFGEPLGNGLHTTLQDAAHKAGFSYDTTPGHLPGEKVNVMSNVVPGNILHTSAKDYLVVAKDGNNMRFLDDTGKIVDLSKIHLDPRDSEFAFCKLANDNQPYPQGTPFGKNMDPDNPMTHTPPVNHDTHHEPVNNPANSSPGTKPQTRPSVSGLIAPTGSQGRK